MEDKKTDEFDSFATTLASKLRRLNEIDGKEASNCQFELHKVLHEFETKLL